MKHKWWHWWFESTTSTPYRFVQKWYGTKVVYKNVYCGICRCVVRLNYRDEP